MLYAMPELDAADLRVLGELDEMRSELRTHLRSKPHWEGRFRRSLFAAAIQESNTIEGITISGSDARALVEHAPMSAEARCTSTKPSGPRSREAASRSATPTHG